jgi:pyruvate/2-oxoglutarate dehydrogenase complex dihydrolipoamide acyltransferase (E2) component
MSSLMTLKPKTPQELRPLLHQKLDTATDAEIAAVHRMLLEMEARRLADELGEETDQLWASGQITEEKIAEAIREHRQAHPYR